MLEGWNVYKFQDKADGNFSFIAAKTKKEAEEYLNHWTTLEFEYLGFKPINEIDIKKPFFVFNKIVVF